MADDGKIELFGALKAKGSKPGPQGGRAPSHSIEFTISKDLTFDGSDEGLRRLGEQVAGAIRDTMRANMLAGKAPDGEPLPEAAEATIERRARYAREFGVKSALVKGWEEVKRAVGKEGKAIAKGELTAHKTANVMRRYVAPKLGQHVPGSGSSTLFGFDSGMLARSVYVIFARGAWWVKFATPRSNIDATGGSAVSRVFSRLRMWSDQGQGDPRVQNALRDAIGAILGPARSLLKAIKRTASEAARLERNVEAIGETE